MRRLLMIATVVALFTGCKKENKGDGTATPPATGSAAPMGTEPGSAAEKTPPPAGDTAPANDMKDNGGSMTTPPAGGSMTAPPSMAGGARPASVTDAQVAVADKLIAALEDLGKAVGAAGKDCKAAAAALKSGAAKLQPIADEAEKFKDATDKDPAAKQWFQQTYGAKMMGALGPMMSVAQSCGNDKDFMDAMQSMPMGKKKSSP